MGVVEMSLEKNSLVRAGLWLELKLKKLQPLWVYGRGLLWALVASDVGTGW